VRVWRAIDYFLHYDAMPLSLCQEVMLFFFLLRYMLRCCHVVADGAPRCSDAMPTAFQLHARYVKQCRQKCGACVRCCYFAYMAAHAAYALLRDIIDDYY